MEQRRLQQSTDAPFINTDGDLRIPERRDVIAKAQQSPGYFRTIHKRPGIGEDRGEVEHLGETVTIPQRAHVALASANRRAKA